jgi:XTP/dITP diphosphohydrolase
MVDNKIEINFASNNAEKIAEVTVILGAFSIRVKAANLKTREIQADDLEEIAADSAKATAEYSGRTIVVEDAGLFINSLQGFPGPYSSFVHRTIGCTGILRLMKGVNDRTAIFRSAVSYCRFHEEPKVFTGEIRGEISLSEKVGRKFGYDPIFIPDGLDGRAFSELSIGEKNKVSHRFKAFSKFANWVLETHE